MKPSTRGLGRIFKPKNSRFWHCAFYHASKEIRESSRVEWLEPDPLDPKSKDKAEKAENAARRYLRSRTDALQAERAGGPALVTPEQKRVTVSELLQGLENEYRKNHQWTRKTESNLKPLRSYFGHVRAVDVTKAMVTAYIVKLQADGYRDSTVNRRVQLLLQSFTIAEREAPRVKKLSEIGNERKGFFERAEYLRVVEHLPEHLKDYCRFAYITGWRRGALSTLEWADVDDSKVYLRAVNSKNRKPVTVPLVGEIAEIVARRRAVGMLPLPSGDVSLARFVFHRGDGQPIGDFRKSWASACKAGGVTGKLFHDLRRTAARNLVAAGIPESVAMTVTGHVTRSVFDRYSISSEGQKVDALRDLATHQILK